MLGSQIAKPCCKICLVQNPSVQVFLNRGFRLHFPELPLKRKSVWLWGSDFQAEFLLML